MDWRMDCLNESKEYDSLYDKRPFYDIRMIWPPNRFISISNCMLINVAYLLLPTIGMN